MCRHTERYIIKKQTERQPNNRCMCILQTERLNDILVVGDDQSWLKNEVIYAVNLTKINNDFMNYKFIK